MGQTQAMEAKVIIGTFWQFNRNRYINEEFPFSNTSQKYPTAELLHTRPRRLPADADF